MFIYPDDNSPRAADSPRKARPGLAEGKANTSKLVTPSEHGPKTRFTVTGKTFCTLFEHRLGQRRTQGFG
jgi:hypothetical protein